jgi:hypothetical protein
MATLVDFYAESVRIDIMLSSRKKIISRRLKQIAEELPSFRKDHLTAQ